VPPAPELFGNFRFLFASWLWRMENQERESDCTKM